MPITVAPNNLTAYCFGGVFDVEDDEEDIAGTFFNDLILLDLEKLQWRSVSLAGKKTKEKTRRNKNKATQSENEEDEDDEMEVEEIEESVRSTVISDDGIFKVTVGPAPTSSTSAESPIANQVSYFQPSARMNCGLAVKHGTLYLYGGMCEDGDKEITYNDFYALDLKKLSDWRTIIADDVSKVEWLGSESEDESGSGEESSESDDSNEMDD